MYQLVVRQQPIQGRMSGFSGTQNQRNIEPALVIQVVLNNPKSPPALQNSFSHSGSIACPAPANILGTGDWQRLICHVSLLKADGVTPAMAVLNSTKSRIKNNIISNVEQLKDLEQHEVFESLLGSHTNCGEVFKDIDGTDAVFFIFGDLGVRSPGTYRLCCRLILPRLSENVSPVLDEVITSAFTIYSPKLYPGLIPPTDLSIWLAKHGAKISVRRQRTDTNTPATESGSP